MVLTPYYCWVDEEEVYVHYKRVAEAVSLPIMLYNHPASTVLDIEATAGGALGRDRQHPLHKGIDYRHASRLPDQRSVQGQDHGLRRLSWATNPSWSGPRVGCPSAPTSCRASRPSSSSSPSTTTTRTPPGRCFKDLVPLDRLPGRPPLRSRHEGGIQDAGPRHGRLRGPPRLPMRKELEPSAPSDA